MVVFTCVGDLVDQRVHQVDVQRIERRGVILDPRRNARAVVREVDANPAINPAVTVPVRDDLGHDFVERQVQLRGDLRADAVTVTEALEMFGDERHFGEVVGQLEAERGGSFGHSPSEALA